MSINHLRALLLVAATLLLGGCGVAAPVTFNPPPTATNGIAFAALNRLPVNPPARAPGYRRAEFMPHGWTDPDKNGCDSRRDVLKRQAVGQPTLAGPHSCVLIATVHDPYSDTDLPSTRVDVDHVVPLGAAWQTGAASWPPARREQFSNDPLNLIAVSASLNRAKGDKDAAGWLPPNQAFRCGYIVRQIAVKQRYQLWLLKAEHDAMARVLKDCPTQTITTQMQKIARMTT